MLACAVDKICIPLRRGGGELLWAALHDGASAALDPIDGAATAATQNKNGVKKAAKGKRPPPAAAVVDGVGAGQWAARMVACVCHAVEFYRGSRVEDYGPLFALAQRLLRGLPAATAAEAECAAAHAEVRFFDGFSGGALISRGVAISRATDTHPAVISHRTYHQCVMPT